MTSTQSRSSSIDIGGGPQAVGAGVVTSNFDLGVLSVGNVGFPGQNLSFDAGAGYDFLSFGEQRDATFTYVARDAGGLTDSGHRYDPDYWSE